MPSLAGGAIETFQSAISLAAPARLAGQAVAAEVMSGGQRGWTHQTTVVEWVDVGSDFSTTHWSDEDPFESAAKAEAAGVAWARSMIDSGEIRGL